jgi:hypothetical protein
MNQPIPFEELMRYEVTNNEDYYAVVQYLDEREDLFNELEQEVNGGCDIDEINMIQSEIDEIDAQVLAIRKKYNDKLKRLD